MHGHTECEHCGLPSARFATLLHGVELERDTLKSQLAELKQALSPTPFLPTVEQICARRPSLRVIDSQTWARILSKPLTPFTRIVALAHPALWDAGIGYGRPGHDTASSHWIDFVLRVQCFSSTFWLRNPQADISRQGPYKDVAELNVTNMVIIIPGDSRPTIEFETLPHNQNEIHISGWRATL